MTPTSNDSKRKPKPAKPTAPNPKRARHHKGTREEVYTENRLRLIGHLYNTGHTLEEIGNQLGIHFSNVSRALKKCRLLWRQDYTSSFNEKVESELAKLDAVEAECWSEYRRSKAGHRKQTTRTTRGPGDAEKGVVTGTETTVTVEVQCGDPRYLTEINRCIDRRLRLLGLDAATKIESSGGVTLHVVEEIVDAVQNFAEKAYQPSSAHQDRTAAPSSA